MGIGKLTKKMKIGVTLFCLSLSLISYEGIAQKFYLKAGGGYKLESGKTSFMNADPNGFTDIMTSLDFRVGSDNTATVEGLNGTFGAGLELALTGGYEINNFLAAELGVVYLNGKETTIGRYQDQNSTQETTAYLDGVLLSPALVIDPGFSGVNPYVRAGMVLTAAGKLFIDTSVDAPNGAGPGTDVRVDARTEIEPGFSVGFAGAIGALFPINEKFSLFGELEFRNFTIRPDKGEITEYSTLAVSNGSSDPIPGLQLDDLPVFRKSFVFSDSYQIPLGTEPPLDEPSNLPGQNANTGSLGFNFGVQVKF